MIHLIKFHSFRNSFVLIPIYLSFLGLLALNSCSSLRIIQIEIAKQSQYPIAEDIQSVALLNRSMTSKFTNSKIDSVEKILINNRMLLDSVFQDSIAADTVIKVAAKALFASGRFDVVVPKEPNIVRSDSFDLANPININFLNEICSDFKVDAVLVLESFIERIKTKYFMHGGEYFGTTEYEASTDITYKSDWRFYRPTLLKPVTRFQFVDSIYWKLRSYSLEELYVEMPLTKDALVGGGIAAGKKIAELISPAWISQNRYYFLTGKKEIDAAIPLIKNNKWEEAAAIWGKYTTINSKLIRSKVEFNLALASEMSGNVDQAIEWGLKSYKTRYSKAAEEYLKTLDDRKKARDKENKTRY